MLHNKPIACRICIGFVFLLILSLSMASFAESGSTRLLRIGTGGKTGVYYPIGKIIAHGLTPDIAAKMTKQDGETGVAGYIGVAQNSAGSIENVRGVVLGEMEAGLVQADVAACAFAAGHAFKGNNKARSVRAIASLYPEKFQVVVRKDADAQSFGDLRGKRISVDEIQSGTLAVMRIVLGAHGMTEKDLQPVYLKPVFTHDKMISGELQGFVMMAGTPMAAVSQLADVGISIVPIAPEVAAQIEVRYPYLVPGTISAEVYRGVPETATIQVYALLLVSREMDTTLAYNITAALWSNRTRAMLKSGHPQGSAITPETALTGISIPLHPGAKKYYREKGLHPSNPLLQ